MAKSKKKRQQDFQKVKLKVGKKLPKGDNVTNLSFKTRQIKLTQKIKVDDGTTPVTKNNLGILDLLRQCDHHSSTVRVNALCGLKELWLNHYSDLLVSSNVNGYGIILKKLSSLLIDNESVVRHSVINLFKLILTKLSSRSSEGHHKHSLGGSLFAYIHTYLCCAMNHIHEDIKLDALLLFDSLLDTFPTLMTQQTGDLLKNLIGLISTPAYIGSKACTTTQKLSLNPDSKLPAMKYRAKVLQRIKRTFMEALKDELGNQNANQSKTEPQACSKWNANSEDQKLNSSLVTKEAERKFSVLFFSGSHELDDYITNPSSLEAFIKIAVPVLLQCWKEARASIDEHSSSDILLPADSLEVMSLVASVIQFMFVLCSTSQKSDQHSQSIRFRLVSPEFLVRNYLQDFESLFLSSFPYTAQALPELTKKRKRSKNLKPPANTETSQLSLNLALCDIMSSFYTDMTLKSIGPLKKIRNYIQRICQKSLNTEHTKVIVRILTNVFSNPHTVGYFVHSYKAAFKHYLSCSVETTQKHLFYSLFSFMNQTWDGWQREKSGSKPVNKYEGNTEIQSILTEFCENLPALLMEVIKFGNQVWLLDIFLLLNHCCMNKSRPVLRQLLMKKLSETLDVQSTLLLCKDSQAQNQFFFLISMGMLYSRDLIKQILYCLRRPMDKPIIQDHSVASHLIYSVMLNIRELVPLRDQLEFNAMSQQQHNRLSNYLRFLFSLQLGFVSEELEVHFPTDPAQPDFFNVNFNVEGVQWSRHVEITQVVAKELANMFLPALPQEGYSENFYFFSNIEQLWKQTFDKRSNIHALSVYSLVRFVYETSFPHVTAQLSADFYDFTALIIASTLIGLFSKDQSIFEEMAQQIKTDIIVCLTQDKLILHRVAAILDKTIEANDSSGGEKKLVAATAKDFLISNKVLNETKHPQV